MPNGSGKPGVERQTHLPLSRAFIISINNLKIRFGRSVITAGGVFLGIAFLSTVLTQSLMQWPVPEKIDAGFVRMDGQINGPGDIEIWKPVPVDAGIDAGIPTEVMQRVAEGAQTFDLRLVVQGRIDALRAEKNLERAKEDLAALNSVDKALYSEANADEQISVKKAVKAGIPQGVAKRLAGEGKTFSGAALAEAMEAQPKTVDHWQKRLEENKEFLKVSQESIDKLGNPDVNPDTPYVLTVDEALERAKGQTEEADMQNVMIVNTGGRKIGLNFNDSEVNAGQQKLTDGDYVLVPDRNTRYRAIWLVVMSLLVCTVGITNSMLMSVTERFKEIGTMKCLGALDRFVVTLFMLESGMMGVVASIFGWAIGFVLIVLVAGLTKGWDVVGNMGFVDIIKTFVTAVIVGLALTMIATIIPAKRAADMPAAMALRSEI